MTSQILTSLLHPMDNQGGFLRERFVIFIAIFFLSVSWLGVLLVRFLKGPPNSYAAMRAGFTSKLGVRSRGHGEPHHS